MYNNSHKLFHLKGVVEEGHVPLTRHFECDIEVGGQIVHRVGILVKKDKVPLNDSRGRSARTPALIGSNLISLALNESCETYGEECIHLFECPIGISPLWFSTLCLYYFAHVTKKAGVGASPVSSDPSNDRAIVTISHFQLLYSCLNVCFYPDFILLTCTLWQLVRLVGLVVLFSYLPNILPGV